MRKFSTSWPISLLIPIKLPLAQNPLGKALHACQAQYSPNPWTVFPWINGIKLLTKLFQFCHLTSLTLIRSGYHVPRHATMFYDKRTKKYKGWVHGCPFFFFNVTSFYSLQWIHRNLFYYSIVFCMFDTLYNENYTFRPKKKKHTYKPYSSVIR